jgi:hypothetical protein
MMQKFFMDELFFLYLVVINFRYFNEEKIDQPLHAVQPFRQALFMVEDVIDNDQLCRYFSYMIQPDLRDDNFFDPNKAIEHVNQTRDSLKNLCSQISFTMGDIPDDYSRFRGIRSASAKHDVIIFNSDMINGLCNSRQYFDSQLCMEIFFIFVKLLHELSHACILESGRHMNKHDPKRFHSPMTYCLQGEAGLAMERMLFGSKIDAPGYTIDDQFIIQYLTFTDGVPSGVIDQDWINLFVEDALNRKKLKEVQNIPRVPYVYLTKALQAELEGGKKIVKKSCRHFDDFDEEN